MVNKLKKPVYIIDTETTGLSHKELILEIAIVKVNTDLTIEFIHEAICGYDTSKWNDWLKNSWIFNNSSLTLDMVTKAQPVNEVIKSVRSILKNKVVTSYNLKYDFQYLNASPWKLDDCIMHHAGCIMENATSECKIHHHYHGYKFPKIEEAYLQLVPQEVRDEYTCLDDQHRASTDTTMGALIFCELVRLGYYNKLVAQRKPLIPVPAEIEQLFNSLSLIFPFTEKIITEEEAVGMWYEQGIALVKKTLVDKLGKNYPSTKTGKEIYGLDTMAKVNRVLISNKLLDYEKIYFLPSGPCAFSLNNSDYAIIVSPLLPEFQNDPDTLRSS